MTESELPFHVEQLQIDKEVVDARNKNLERKKEHEQKVNSSKYKKKEQISIGDQVLTRNFNKRSKFEPIFQKEPWVVISNNALGNKVFIEREGRTLCRHPDDLKIYFDDAERIEENLTEELPEKDESFVSEFIADGEEKCQDEFEFEREVIENESDNATPEPSSRRIREPRDKQPNRRYFNENFICK